MKHVNVCLTNFLTKNEAIHYLQAGFRIVHSHTNSFHKILSDVTYKKQKQITVAMFLDFCKAFDYVNHQILYPKLKNFNIEGSSLQLLKSYLVDRRYFVGFSNQVSKVLPITVGVRQGTILAPTLILMFINDLLTWSFSSSAHAYAGDTTIACSHSHSHQLEQLRTMDFEKIHEWCVLNRMTINIKKSHFLVFRKPKNKICLRIGDDILSQSNNTKLLGIYLTELITWTEHVEKLVTRLQSNINLLKPCKSYISTFAARQFYFQFIHSHLTSGIQLYLNLLPEYLIDSIFLKQKSAMRMIANVHQIPNYLTDTRTLSKTLNILPLPKFACVF